MPGQQPKTGMRRNWVSARVQIASSCAVSGSIIHAGRPVIGIMMSDEWTGSTLGFQVAACPGGTFRELYSDSNEEVLATVGASRAVAASDCLDKLAPWYALKCVSGCKEAQENQAAARTLVIFYEG